jgi:uncharacterized membrane-anchored protein
MRKAFILAAILLQVVALAYMAGEREYLLKNGKVILLRTAPIDPRDLFRGDYVRLNYEISRIGINQLKGVETRKEIKKGDEIFVGLQEGPNGLYEFANARLQRPKEGLYLKGRALLPQQSLLPGSAIWITYGIEAYFVEQGTGHDIEKRLGTRTGVQVPLEMEIAVSRTGESVIKGYRWSPLGIGLQVLRSQQLNPQDPKAPKSAAVRLTLANASDKPLALVNLPNYCSFFLEPVPWAKQQWVPARSPCGPALPADSDIIALAPREEKSVDFDFSSDRWMVRAGGKVGEIGSLDWSEQFRIVYRPPNARDCRHLAQSDLIWHGYLPSRVFHGRGQID